MACYAFKAVFGLKQQSFLTKYGLRKGQAQSVGIASLYSLLYALKTLKPVMRRLDTIEGDYVFNMPGLGKQIKRLYRLDGVAPSAEIGHISCLGIWRARNID